TSRLQAYRVTIGRVSVFPERDAAAAFHEYSRRIADKLVSDNLAVPYVFQQQSVCCGSPIVAIGVVDHMHSPGIHYRYTRAVTHKLIVTILVVVREHKVQAVPNVAFTDVMTDLRRRHKLKVYAVAMPFHHVAVYDDMMGFPGMDTISRILFISRCGLQYIVGDV